MCGIVGFFGPKNSELLYQMTDLISHRGPDQDIKYETNQVNIGFRRLSINDLSTGDQPFYDSRNKIGVFCNGEIYNHKELREELEDKKYIFKTNSDCEVILHGYMEYGLEFIKKINGMFFIVIWNDNEQKIFLIRDRLGIKPCYFLKQDNNIFFSSEIKPLLKNKNLRKTLDFSSIDFFLSNRYVPSSKNLLKEISTLEQGSILEISKDFFKNYKYWNYDEHNNIGDKKNENFSDILNSSINLRMVADVKVGLFLSGGLDSSIIASLMARKSTNFEVFTHSFDENKDESHFAKKLCKNLGLNNFNLVEIKNKHIHNLENIIESMEFPIGNSDIIGLDLLCNAAKSKNTKVVLSGEGSDEIFGGYVHHQVLGIIHNFRSFLKFLKINKIFAKGLRYTPNNLLNLFFNYGKYKVTNDLKINLRNYFNENSDLYSYFNLISLFNIKDKNDLYTDSFKNELIKYNNSFILNDKLPNFLDKILRFEIENWLPSYHLMKEDKISMRHSIEMRFPFLDHNIYEFLQKQNSRKYLANNKKYLKDRFSDNLPAFINKRKKGPILVPIIETFKDEFVTMYRDILNENSIKKYNFFNFNYIQKLFFEFENNKNYILANKIFSLMTLQIWLNKFLK